MLTNTTRNEIITWPQQPEYSWNLWYSSQSKNMIIPINQCKIRTDTRAIAFSFFEKNSVRSPSFCGMKVVQPLASIMNMKHIIHQDIKDIKMVNALMIVKVYPVKQSITKWRALSMHFDRSWKRVKVIKTRGWSILLYSSKSFFQ